MKSGQRMRVHVVTMGCAKNVVDSEKLMGQMRIGGIEIAPDIEHADAALINTCGFITAAKKESIDAIIAHVRWKAKGKLRKVYAMGCLTERYRSELEKEIPEVDRFFGSNDMAGVLRELGALYRRELIGERVLTTPAHIAYLKVSEGCDNPCSFCAIPLMRGRHTSRPMEEIVQEAGLLAARGVKEIVLIGQDTTCYGIDLYGKRRIGELLDRVAGSEGVAWTRLMYAYPAKFPAELLESIAGNPRVCKYLDLPLQHIADPVLKSMRRGISRRGVMALIRRIRDAVDGIALRTTLIVGYPNEGEKEFDELLSFVREAEFDRLGVFPYSQEDGTGAFGLGDPVPEPEKERRQALIMEAQQEISNARNETLVGSRQVVLIDRVERELCVGRTERDAPDIDNEVFVDTRAPHAPGEFIEVDIVGCSEYDLYGRI